VLPGVASWLDNNRSVRSMCVSLCGEDGADELARRLVPLDEEAMQRVVGVETLGGEDDVGPHQDCGLDVVSGEISVMGVCNRKPLSTSKTCTCVP
jgi:hypothetical protein